MNCAMMLVMFCQVIETHNGGDNATLIAIRDLAASNTAKFQSGSLRMTFQDGKAANADAARRGDLTEVAVAESRYRYNSQGRAFYDLRFSLKSLQAATLQTSATSAAAMLISYQTVTNGEMTLYESIYPAGSILRGATSATMGTNQFYTGLRLPLRLGFPPRERGDTEFLLGRVIDHRDGFFLKSMDLKAIRDGRIQPRFVTANPRGACEFQVDLEHGGVSSYSSWTLPSGYVAEGYNDKIEFVPGHGWLPFNITLRNNSSSRVKRIVVDGYDFDTPLDATAFDLTLLSPGAWPHPLTGKLSPALTTYNLDKLPASFTKAKTPLAVPSASVSESKQPELPRMGPSNQPRELEVPPSNRWLLMSIAVGLLAIIGGFWVWLKRR